MSVVWQLNRHWLILGCFIAGCASMLAGSGPPAELTTNDRWLVVPNVKFHGQVGRDGCGPAALDMVLERWGVAARSQSAARERGMRAGELRDRARQLGLQSFVVPGTVVDLRRELAAGHPVVLGLSRRQMLHAYFHFVVLAGASLDLGEWLLADPDRGWQRVAADELMAEWNATNRVMVVAYPAVVSFSESINVAARRSSS